METLIYVISGMFFAGITWEDFFPKKGHVGVKATIWLDAELAAVDNRVLPNGAVFSFDLCAEDCCFDVYVSLMDEETCRCVLAILNNRTPLNDVVIEQRGICIAV